MFLPAADGDELKLGLTDREVDLCNSLFDMFDRDKSGCIDYDELLQILAYMGAILSDEEVLQLLNCMDADESGEIERSEFMTFLRLYKESSRLKVINKSNATNECLAHIRGRSCFLPDDRAVRLWKCLVLAAIFYFASIIAFWYTHPLELLPYGVRVLHALASTVLSVDMLVSYKTLSYAEESQQKAIQRARGVHVAGVWKRLCFYLAGLLDTQGVETAVSAVDEVDTDAVFEYHSQPISQPVSQPVSGQNSKASSMENLEILSMVQTTQGRSPRSKPAELEQAFPTKMTMPPPRLPMEAQRRTRRSLASVMQAVPKEKTPREKVSLWIQTELRRLALWEVNTLYTKDTRVLTDAMSAMPFDLVLYAILHCDTGPVFSFVSFGNETAYAVESSECEGAGLAVFLVSHLRLLRVLQLRRLFPTSPQSLIDSTHLRFFFSFVPVFQTVLCVAFVLHLSVCIWIILNGRETDYLTGLYYVLYTLQAVGYGDVAVDTTAKKFFAMAICFGGVIGNGAIVGMLTIIIQSTSVDKQGVMIRTVFELKKYDLPTEFYKDVLGYQAQNILNRNDPAAVEETLTRVPDSVGENMQLYLKSAFLSEVPLLREAPATSKLTLAASLTSVELCPEELLILSGECMARIYFLSHGLLDVFSNTGDESCHVATLSRAACLGDHVLIGKHVSPVSVKALSFCRVLYLRTEDFIYAMHCSAELKQAIREVFEASYTSGELRGACWHKTARPLSPRCSLHPDSPRAKRSVVPEDESRSKSIPTISCAVTMSLPGAVASVPNHDEASVGTPTLEIQAPKEAKAHRPSFDAGTSEQGSPGVKPPSIMTTTTAAWSAPSIDVFATPITDSTERGGSFSETQSSAPQMLPIPHPHLRSSLAETAETGSSSTLGVGVNLGGGSSSGVALTRVPSAMGFRNEDKKVDTRQLVASTLNVGAVSKKARNQGASGGGGGGETGLVAHGRFANAMSSRSMLDNGAGPASPRGSPKVFDKEFAPWAEEQGVPSPVGSFRKSSAGSTEVLAAPEAIPHQGREVALPRKVRRVCHNHDYFKKVYLTNLLPHTVAASLYLSRCDLHTRYRVSAFFFFIFYKSKKGT